MMLLLFAASCEIDMLTDGSFAKYFDGITDNVFVYQVTLIVDCLSENFVYDRMDVCKMYLMFQLRRVSAIFCMTL